MQRTVPIPRNGADRVPGLKGYPSSATCRSSAGPARHPHEGRARGGPRFAPESGSGRPRFAYFPFGGGPRLCIGNNFALMEAQLILAMVMQRHRLELDPTAVVEPGLVLTLRPRFGITMAIKQPRHLAQLNQRPRPAALG